jgi:hypothetical protein
MNKLSRVGLINRHNADVIQRVRYSVPSLSASPQSEIFWGFRRRWYAPDRLVTEAVERIVRA